MNISFSTDRILRPLLRLSRCLTYIEFMYLFIGRNLLPGLIFTYIYRYHEFLKVFFRLFSLLISVPAISVLKFSLFQRSLFGTLHLLIFLLVVFLKWFEMVFLFSTTYSPRSFFPWSFFQSRWREFNAIRQAYCS